MKPVERAIAAVGTEEPPGPSASGPRAHVAGLEALFAPGPTRCDGCDAELPAPAELAPHDTTATFGALLWRRGDTFELEPRPLCEACAAAIGLTALRQWEIEEEEG